LPNPKPNYSPPIGTFSHCSRIVFVRYSLWGARDFAFVRNVAGCPPKVHGSFFFPIVVRTRAPLPGVEGGPHLKVWATNLLDTWSDVPVPFSFSPGPPPYLTPPPEPSSGGRNPLGPLLIAKNFGPKGPYDGLVFGPIFFREFPSNKKFFECLLLNVKVKVILPT